MQIPSNKNHNKNVKNNEQEAEAPLANTDFMREKIKQRPLNHRKLIRRTVITVALAVIFGLVACFTFLYLEPLISNAIYPEDETAKVAFPEESASDEKLPEEMYRDDAEIQAKISADTQFSESASTEKEMRSIISNYSFNSSDYYEMMSSLNLVASKAARCVVTVTGVSSDTDWINEAYEKSGSVSGVIIAKSSGSYLILVDLTSVKDAEVIHVTFCDDSSYKATLKASDSVTGLSVIAVDADALSKSTVSELNIAELGSSASSALAGVPVIALGSPTGIQESICYGAITSGTRILDLPDSAYRLLNTDIYGSPNGSGILINTAGQVTGIISMSYNDSNCSNQLSAYGISELKPLIERLSNGTSSASLGVHGTDIPDFIKEANNIPSGAYITQIEMKSAAMNAGIQSGDIITSFDSATITTFSSLIFAISDHNAGDKVRLTIMRQNPDDYSEMHLDVTLNSTDNKS